MVLPRDKHPMLELLRRRLGEHVLSHSDTTVRQVKQTSNGSSGLKCVVLIKDFESHLLEE